MIFLAIVAILIGPTCFYIGLRTGCALQYRAGRGQAPGGLFPRSPKAEVYSEPEPVDPKAAQLMVDLDKLDKESLQSAAEFHAVKWDDRPEMKESIMAAIVRANINPGAMRA